MWCSSWVRFVVSSRGSCSGQGLLTWSAFLEVWPCLLRPGNWCSPSHVLYLVSRTNSVNISRQVLFGSKPRCEFLKSSRFPASQAEPAASRRCVPREGAVLWLTGLVLLGLSSWFCYANSKTVGVARLRGGMGTKVLSDFLEEHGPYMARFWHRGRLRLKGMVWSLKHRCLLADCSIFLPWAEGGGCGWQNGDLEKK